MSAGAPALVTLVGIVALGLGGYEPWAVLVLEVGAAALALALVVERSWLRERNGAGERERARAREAARYAAWRRLPFFARYPGVARAVKLLSFGRARVGASSAGVEFVLPGADPERNEVRLDPSSEGFLLGLPFRRSGLFWPLALMTLWIGLSVVPMARGWLATVSPRAHEARLGAESLVGLEPAAAPTSVVPFLTARDLWIWLAVLTLFALSARYVRGDARNASRLALAIIVLGAASGLHGLVGWLDTLTEAFGVASTSMRARGSFGNANHYAMFQGMTVLVGLGWLVAASTSRSARTEHGRRSDARGRAGVAALGVILAALGLVLSLSRSGIAFTLVAAVVLVVLGSRSVSSGSGGRRRRSSSAAYAAVGLSVLALIVWLGIDPIVARFGDLTEELDREGTRVEIWRDSLPALRDFWLTGSGLASFRYVGTFYRVFPGNFFYSWAHNDYLQLAIELGAPGVLLLGAILASWMRAARRARARLANDIQGSVLHAGYVSALVCVGCHSMTDFGLHLPANLALLALVGAAAVAMGTVADADADAGTETEQDAARAFGL